MDGLGGADFLLIPLQHQQRRLSGILAVVVRERHFILQLQFLAQGLLQGGRNLGDQFRFHRQEDIRRHRIAQGGGDIFLRVEIFLKPSAQAEYFPAAIRLLTHEGVRQVGGFRILRQDQETVGIPLQRVHLDGDLPRHGGLVRLQIVVHGSQDRFGHRWLHFHLGSFFHLLLLRPELRQRRHGEQNGQDRYWRQETDTTQGNTHNAADYAPGPLVKSSPSHRCPVKFTQKSPRKPAMEMDRNAGAVGASPY